MLLTTEVTGLLAVLRLLSFALEASLVAPLCLTTPLETLRPSLSATALSPGRVTLAKRLTTRGGRRCCKKDRVTVV